MSIEAMKQALEALHVHAAPHPMVWRAMDALRLAIEHAERPQTHSEECWRWHHECAVAKIQNKLMEKNT